jgi:Ca-activated chloride channel family protein
MIEDFRFAYPLVLLLFVPALLYLWRLWRRQRDDSPAALRYSDLRLLAGLPVGWRVRWRWLPDALRLLAWALLVIALARPQGGNAREIIQGRGIDIVMTLDISGSMATDDFAPFNRLEAAKEVMADFIDGRTFDRIGLVVFAEDAFFQSPPTLDYGTLQRLLANVALAPDVNLSNRTAIGVGIGSSLNMLRNSDAVSKVIILMTDGANNAGILDPISAARAARALDVHIYAIGMGFAGGDGELDETTLREITNIANGRYYNALDIEDLRDIYSEIDQLERSMFERRLVIQWQDWAWSWLLGAVILLLLERIMRQTIFQTIP